MMPLDHKAHRTGSHRHAARGLTLIELMVAIVLLGVITAIAVPSMVEFIARKRVQGVADQLMQDLRFAKSMQSSLGSYVFIRFQQDPAQTCYSIFEGSGSVCNCLTGHCAGASRMLKGVSLPRSDGPAITANGVGIVKLMGSAGQPVDPVETLIGLRTATLLSFDLTVASANGGSVQVQTNHAFVPRICSVSGHHSAYKPCPE